MDALVHSTGGMTDAEMEAPTKTQAMARGLGYKGPRNYSDEELGLDDGPITQRVIKKAGPAAVVGTPVTQQERTGLAAPKPNYTPERLNEMAHQSGELENDPTAQFVVGGVLSGGAANLIGGGARAVALSRGLAKPAANALGRIAGGAGGGATGAYVQGGSPKDVAIGAALGGALVAVPEGLSAAGRGLQAGAKKLRGAMLDPRREMGRTARGLQEAEQSGIMETPEFKALRSGPPGSNQAAIQAEENIAARNEAATRTARQEYGAEQSRIFNKDPDRYHYIPDAHEALGRIEADNTINGVVGDEQLGKAVQKVRDMLTAKTGVMDRTATAAAVEQNPGAGAQYIDAPAVKVADLVKTKRIVDEMAGFGSPATPENVPYRKLSSVLAKELEGIDPEMTALNQRYAGAMGKAEETNQLLYGKDAADVMRTPAQTRRASGMLGRVGDETQAGTLSEPQIERLKQLDPGNARDIAFVEAKKNFERTRFGMPHVSRRFEHLPFGFITQNAQALGIRGVLPLLERLELAEPVLGQVSPEAIAAGLGAAPRNRKENRR